MSPQRSPLALTAIWNMSFGFFGIQFGWGLQMANMSAIYQYLGASESDLAILWLAAPVTGLIVQPIIGHYSDHTWTRLGRRRPYFLAGAILASLALVAMPNSSSLWMAAGLLWVLDASVNISMEPFRAFVGDLLPSSQRQLGFSMQSLLIGLGAVGEDELQLAEIHFRGIGGDRHGMSLLRRGGSGFDRWDRPRASLGLGQNISPAVVSAVVLDVENLGVLLVLLLVLRRGG